MYRTINVCPDTFEMSSRETLPISFDVAPLLELGEEPVPMPAVLIDQRTGVDHAIGHPGTPIVQGTELVQTVTALVPGCRYLLSMPFVAAPGKIWAPSLNIVCPE